MFNFKDSYALFSDRGACGTVYDSLEFSEKIIYILNNTAVRQKMGDEALAIIHENRGAAKRSVEFLKQRLGWENHQ